MDSTSNLDRKKRISSNLKKYFSCLFAVPAFNQPPFLSHSSWNPYAVTFTSRSILGYYPAAIFINTNNTLFMVDTNYGEIFIWDDVCDNLTRIISTNLSSAVSLFVTIDDKIFISGGSSSGSRVERWSSNGTQLSSPISLFGCSPCYSLFVDLSNNLYCSQQNRHQVARLDGIDPSNTLRIVAGTGTAGSDAYTLYSPAGIFVTSQLDLYVADYINSRVQLFRSGQSNATTVTGNFSLSYPTGVTVDGNGNVFIVDRSNHRVVWSGPSGSGCVVGCWGWLYGFRSASYALYNPSTLSFDSSGNMFVVDTSNARIQKFLFSPNSCSK
jgi:DNA-binding beta-propeller fold protein YncE